MTASRRFLIVLLLLCTLPLRGLAASTLSCCPLEASQVGSSHAMTSMTDATTGEHPHDRSSGVGDPRHHASASTCCVAAMIAPSTLVVAFSPAHRATSVDPRVDPVVAFLTDAPERPPRLRPVFA